jgi:hypothetical protein
MKRWMSLVALAGGLWSNIAGAEVFLGESPRTGMFEVKLGNFGPNLDREFAGTATPTPIGTLLGGTSMLYAELEYDWQFFQKYGSIAAGFSLGYGEKYGRAVVATTGEPSAEKTGLIVLPLKLLAVYRFDYFAIHNSFPLVPYVKGSLIYMPWWIVKGGKVEYFADADGVRRRGAGGKWGVGGTIGVSFLLDILEPRMARDFDSDIGVNHVYLFGEYEFSRVNNFGQRGFDFSDRHFMAGLGFEF